MSCAAAGRKPFAASFSCLAHFSAKPPVRPSSASDGANLCHTQSTWAASLLSQRQTPPFYSSAAHNHAELMQRRLCLRAGPGASSPLVRQAITPPMQDYGTLAAAHQHCEPLLKATPTVRLQATRDKQNSTQPSSRTPDSIHVVVGTTQWSAPRSPQNEATTRDRSTLVTTATSAPSQPSAECRRSRSKQQLHGAGKQCTDSASERHSSQTPYHSPT